ncbi:MAG: guanylate kinase [Dehalococcoidales bacterium]|nr:guanylate kinase [Dehalococcoidales bacterium]
MNPEQSSAIGPPSGPLLVVLSGLSGVGKDTVLSRLRQSAHPLEFIVTVTTRPQRPNERDGVHYRFVSEAAFREMIDSGKLLEYAEVYGNYYGVPSEPVKKALADEKDVVVKVDVQGAATIRKAVPEAVFIFLAAASMQELESRLRQRSTESESDLALRLETAAAEMEQLPVFDYIVVNRRGEINRAVADIDAIITAEKCRVVPRKIQL